MRFGFSFFFAVAAAPMLMTTAASGQEQTPALSRTPDSWQQPKGQSSTGRLPDRSPERQPTPELTHAQDIEPDARMHAGPHAMAGGGMVVALNERGRVHGDVPAGGVGLLGWGFSGFVVGARVLWRAGPRTRDGLALVTGVIDWYPVSDGGFHLGGGVGVGFASATGLSAGAWTGYSWWIADHLSVGVQAGLDYAYTESFLSPVYIGGSGGYGYWSGGGVSTDHLFIPTVMLTLSVN